MAKKKTFKETMDLLWPKTKKEMEKVIKNTKKVLGQAEKYLKSVSDKGVEKTKKISLQLKREKLYYDLGKIVASADSGSLASNRKVSSFLKKIKDIEKEIKK